jgi:radical SAM protein with 4Fe4S-binding SPASM domain
MIQRPVLSIQWHVTARCDQRCSHCYVYDERTYQRELAGELSLGDCRRVIDDYARTLRRWGALGDIGFSGGDPLLRRDFFEILAHARRRGFGDMGVLGNPYHLDRRTARRLREGGVSAYQMSIDGMRATHDRIRKPGSFDASLRGFEVLKSEGIESLMMFTLTPQNKHDLIEVIRLADRIGVDGFTFARVAAVGEARDEKPGFLKKPGFFRPTAPSEYREIYLRAIAEYERLRRRGSQTNFMMKDHLWTPLFVETGRVRDAAALRGRRDALPCGMGEAHLTLLADGTVLPCRRLPLPIGRVPGQSFADIWLRSGLLNRLRDRRRYRKCGRCVYASFCMGCPAVAFGRTGDPFAPDPQCWIGPA